MTGKRQSSMFNVPLELCSLATRGTQECSIFILLISLFLISCDSIAEDDRLIHVPLPAVGCNVLIEDFTGQLCVNCPNAAEEIQRLQQQYGSDTVIAVGIHGGPLAVYSNARVVGLRTELGDEYYSHWKVEQEPSGLINRTGSVTTHDQWAGQVNKAVSQQATVDLSGQCRYDSTSHLLTVSVSVTGQQAVSGRLQVWLTESGITALQSMPDGTNNANYIHNHVLRCAVNGAWGEPVELAEAETQTFNYSCTTDPAWEGSNLSAVIFVYNDQGVQQVIEIHPSLAPTPSALAEGRNPSPFTMRIE